MSEKAKHNRWGGWELRFPFAPHSNGSETTVNVKTPRAWVLIAMLLVVWPISNTQAGYSESYTSSFSTHTTSCKEETWNLKYNLWRSMYEPGLKSEMDILYGEIENADTRNEYYNNILIIVGSYVQYESVTNSQTAIGLLNSALSAESSAISTLYGSGTTGAIVAPKIIDALSAAITVVTEPNPAARVAAITDYLVLNTLSIANDTTATIIISTLRKQFERLSTVRQVLDSYYLFCGNQARVVTFLGIDNDVNDCGSTWLICATEKYGQSISSSWSMNRDDILEAHLKILSGINRASASSVFDNDGDGLTDEEDFDDDNDGMPDSFEQQFNLNRKKNSDAASDTDGDGLSNLSEFHATSNPTDTDTDSDGVLDGTDTVPAVVNTINSSLTVTFPNWGESLYRGKNYTIAWDSQSITGTVKVELYKGDIMVRQLAASAENTGTYPFSPNDEFVDGSDYKIALSASNGTVYDFSDTFFSIQNAPSLTVTLPNIGDVLYVGKDYTITWDSSNVTGTVQIDMYKGDTMVRQLAASAPNTGSYPFSPISEFEDGDDYRIGISTANGTVYDFSDHYFTIQAACRYELYPSMHNLSAAIGTHKVLVTTQTGCGWSSSYGSGSDWFEIQSGDFDPDGGSGEITFLVNENTTGINRTGTLNIQPQGMEHLVFEIHQGDSVLHSIASGNRHTVIVKPTTGTVWAWGENSNGQLGDGTTTNRNNPVQVSDIANVIAVAAGQENTFALKSGGTVWSWGDNTYGQLGNGNQNQWTPTLIPTQVSGLTDIVSIASGSSHALALKADGTVWAWGDNSYGQLGYQSSTFCRVTWSVLCSTVPAQIQGLHNVVAISAYADHSVALKADGTVWTWGQNYYGQLGYQSDGFCNARNNGLPCSETPKPVDGLQNVKNITSGYYHNAALKTNGTVQAHW